MKTILVFFIFIYFEENCYLTPKTSVKQFNRLSIKKNHKIVTKRHPYHHIRLVAFGAIFITRLFIMNYYVL